MAAVIAEIALGIVLGFVGVRVGSIFLRVLWMDYFSSWFLLSLPSGKRIPRWYWLVSSLVTGKLSR